jgi:hypothetical protein
VPKIGEVEYDEAGFEHMRQLLALHEDPATTPARARELVGEAATMNEIYRQFPGVKMVSPQAGLPSPDENRIGKFHGPAAGAPSTEREAAIRVYPNSGTARRRVLDHIAAAGDAGATDEEISLALSMRLYTAAPRRNELLNDGWIRDSGRTRQTTTGTRAVVWIMTASGRSEWRPPA